MTAPIKYSKFEQADTSYVELSYGYYPDHPGWLLGIDTTNETVTIEIEDLTSFVSALKELMPDSGEVSTESHVTLNREQLQKIIDLSTVYPTADEFTLVATDNANGYSVTVDVDHTSACVLNFDLGSLDV